MMGTIRFRIALPLPSRSKIRRGGERVGVRMESWVSPLTQPLPSRGEGSTSPKTKEAGGVSSGFLIFRHLVRRNNAIRAAPAPVIGQGCYARYSPRPTFLTALISGRVLLMALVKFFVEVL